MLVEFQQALADLVASPALCCTVLEDPSILIQRYRLDEEEQARLLAMVEQRGMECTSMLYREPNGTARAELATCHGGARRSNETSARRLLIIRLLQQPTTCRG